MSSTHTHIESNTGSIQDVPVPKPKILCFTLAEVQMRDTLSCLDSVSLAIPESVLLISCKGLREGRQSSSPARETERADLGTKLGRRGQGRGLWVKMRSEEGGRGGGAPEAGALSLTCIPQMYSRRLSWAETLDLCVRPPSL